MEMEMDAVELFNGFPEGCVCHILSFTSPRDACRSSAVCSTFRSALESDVLWEKFLPSDWSDIVSRSATPLEFSTKKELYFLLCQPILIDEGKMSFSVEKATGKKCYMLSARELYIVWEDNPSYWKWTSLPQSRFAEVAELLSVCWLEIRGTIDSRVLSSKTTYKSYLIIKLTEEAYGFDFPTEMGVKLGGHASTNTSYLQRDPSRTYRHWNALDRLNMWHYTQEVSSRITAHCTRAVSSRINGRVPQARSDGWMEIEIGEFFNDEGEDGKVEMSLMEVKGGNWKAGLIVEGIEIRPVV